MRTLARDAALLLALTLGLGAAANQLRPHRLPWWGQGQQPPMVNVDFRLLDVGTAETLWSSLPRVVVLDTRPAEDGAAGRIPGAWHVEYTDLASFLTAERLAELQQADAVIIYGRDDEGDLEQLMAQELHRRGVQPPFVMVGGFPAWEAAGFEVEVAP